MVFYRKYRPQTIEQLDSEEVKKSLQAVLFSKTVPHAFLFTGPKGLGKTSAARIVAKYVNCEESEKRKAKSEKQETIPCNECDQCVSITNGTNMDVFEIDGASNRGIDEMRDLREKIRLLPVAAKLKVYIIDEVHMLTTEAFNALLKTLEEPPPHALFILCTTEPQKIPSTILSRCFHIQFKKATIEDLVHSFEKILKAEKISADGDALKVIASLSDGSFRDGAKILEEVTLRLKGEKLTKEFMETEYHTSNLEKDAVALLRSLLEKDAKKSLQIIQNITDLGVDIKFFNEKLLFHIHGMLLEKTGIVKEQKWPEVDLGTVKNLAIVISKSYAEIKYAVIPQLPLELAVVEWVGENESRIKNQESRIDNKEKKQVSPPVIPASEPESKEMRKLVQHDKADDKTFFHQILDSIKTQNHMLAGVLRSCKVSIVGETVHIEALSQFHKERLLDKKALDVLEKVCRDISGKSVRISVTLKS